MNKRMCTKVQKRAEEILVEQLAKVAVDRYFAANKTDIHTTADILLQEGKIVLKFEEEKDDERSGTS